MRNVLEEFLKPRRSQRKPTILGLREHIFTGRSAFIITCLIIDWNLLSANGNIASQSAEKHCDFLLVYMLIFPPPPPPSFISVYAHVSLSLSLPPPPPLPSLSPFYSVSSLAWFMSNQETSFVTIGQRILANPLR
jgi:hypothetical protein